jgi:hypothetical protein
MCWMMTLKRKMFPRSIDASSRQVVHIHAMADQEIHCQFREIQVADIKSVFVHTASNSQPSSNCRARRATKIMQLTN